MSTEIRNWWVMGLPYPQLLQLVGRIVDLLPERDVQQLRNEMGMEAPGPAMSTLLQPGTERSNGGNGRCGSTTVTGTRREVVEVLGGGWQLEREAETEVTGSQTVIRT